MCLNMYGNVLYKNTLYGIGAQARKERLSFELLQVVSLLTGEADRRMLTVA